MEYKQIKRKKIYEEIAEILTESIKSGALQPGDKLDSVQQLAENFQVGRSAIREALTSLRAMGLIEMRQGEGTYVKRFEKNGIAFPLQHALLMSREDVTELMEVRRILETGTAAAAASKRTNKHLEALKQAADDMAFYAHDPEQGEKADLAFHLEIAEAAGNKLLASLMHHVSGMTAESMRETRRICLYGKTAAASRLNEQHEAILRAIEQGNEKQAALAMNEHLEFVEQVLFAYMDKQEM